MGNRKKNANRHLAKEQETHYPDELVTFKNDPTRIGDINLQNVTVDEVSIADLFTDADRRLAEHKLMGDHDIHIHGAGLPKDREKIDHFAILEHKMQRLEDIPDANQLAAYMEMFEVGEDIHIDPIGNVHMGEDCDAEVIELIPGAKTPQPELPTDPEEREFVLVMLGRYQEVFNVVKDAILKSVDVLQFGADVDKIANIANEATCKILGIEK